MSPPLHLLRPFTQWFRDGEQVTTVAGARDYVAHIAGLGYDRFQTVTSRMPRRADELAGGSVFFVKSGRTLFRMPFAEVVPTSYGLVVIVMRPQLVAVEQWAVGRVRGWRYLKDRDAPPDLAGPPAAEGDGLPEGLRRELAGLGL